jgi:photosystem II stability/assembly factor-like uncharacterized protein
MIKRFCYVLLFAVFICTLTNCAAIEANKKESATVKNKESTLSNNKTNRANISSRPKLASRIFFLNEKEGWALCFGSKLCQTGDGGRTWKMIADKNLEFCTEIYFVSSQVGFGVVSEWVYTGDANKRACIIRTQDGGKTWKKVSEIDNSSVLSMSFFDEKNGYLTCKYCAYQTLDGGNRWLKVKSELKERDYIKDSPLHLLRKAVIVSPNAMWGYGSGIWFSDDGGKTWETNISYLDVERKLSASCFLDEKNGWIVGFDEQIWHTKDGKTWERIKIPESLSRRSKSYPNEKINFTNVSFVSKNEGWIGGGDGLLYTNDEGVTWQIIYPSGEVYTGSFIFLDSQMGFGLREKREVGFNYFEIVFTSNGGHTWEIKPISN